MKQEIHPGRCAHHCSKFVARFPRAILIDVDNAVLANLQPLDRSRQVAFVAVGGQHGIMDHEQATGRHLQLVGSHRNHRCSRSSRAGDHQMHLARVIPQRVVHPGRSVTASAVTVEDDADVFLGITALTVSTTNPRLAVGRYNGEEIGEITIMYPLAAPIETSLSAEELSAFRAMMTLYPCTTVYNAAGAEMKMDYIADTKNYIDQKIAAIAAAML